MSMICRKLVSPSEVLMVVNDVLGVDINKNTRNRYYINGRAIYYHILRDELGMSYSSIGITLGKDHATVMHSLRDFDFHVEHDHALRVLYKNCIDAINDSTNRRTHPEALYNRLNLLELKLNKWLGKRTIDTDQLDTLLTEMRSLGALKKDILSQISQQQEAIE